MWGGGGGGRQLGWGGEFSSCVRLYCGRTELCGTAKHTQEQAAAPLAALLFPFFLLSLASSSLWLVGE